MKITKAQARKRLNEAAMKVGRVWYGAGPHLTTAEQNELVKIKQRLQQISKKLK